MYNYQGTDICCDYNSLNDNKRALSRLLCEETLLLDRTERRKSQRLSLHMPVFVRAVGDGGERFLEFTTALNVSAGGAMVVLRRHPPSTSQIDLEIPSAPAVGVPSAKSRRLLKARLVWISHSRKGHLLGLRFARPLS